MNTGIKEMKRISSWIEASVLRVNTCILYIHTQKKKKINMFIEGAM